MLDNKILIISTDDDGSYVINYQPERLGKTEAELEVMGTLVSSIPEPEVIEGKDAVLKFDGTNLYYEYITIPLTIEERLAMLQEQIKTTNDTVDFLLGM